MKRALPVLLLAWLGTPTRVLAYRPFDSTDAAVASPGQTAIANPLFGTTTMHVAALFSTWGEDKARAFMDSLKANGVRIASSNGEVKRLVAAGEVAFGLCDTDDGNEAIKEGAPVEVVYPDQDDMGTLVMPTTVVTLRGAPHPEAARRLIDYLLTPEVEKAMAQRSAHATAAGRAGAAERPSRRCAQGDEGGLREGGR